MPLILTICFPLGAMIVTHTGTLNKKGVYNK